MPRLPGQPAGSSMSTALVTAVQSELRRRIGYNSPLFSAGKVGGQPTRTPETKNIDIDIMHGDNKNFNFEAVRGIQWSRAYLWDIIIPSAPPPFDKWFPASDASLIIGSNNQYSFEAGQSQYRIPEFTNMETFRITFFDDEYATLEGWLREWFYDIYGLKDDEGYLSSGNGVGLLGESCRDLYYMKLNSYRQIIEFQTLFVIPTGEPISENNSESKTRQIDITFDVCFKKVVRI